ncbi:MAG: hypothetical protein Q9160_004604 [Pyrenula sp. 1 TL-2023]
MSGSKRNPEDPFSPPKASDTDNPFIAFRRVLDAQVSSLFRSVLPRSDESGRSWPGSGKDLNDFDNAFDEVKKRWDTFLEETRRDAAEFYGPDRSMPKEETMNRPPEGTVVHVKDAQSNCETSRDGRGVGKVASRPGEGSSFSWLGYDGRRRMDSQEEFPTQRPPRKDLHQPSTNQPRQQNERSWISTFARFRPRFFDQVSGDEDCVLKSSQYHGYPIEDLPPEYLDDPFVNHPAAVPFLLHSQYSPINIASTNFMGGRSNSYEEAKLTDIRFKDAFEDLQRLHKGRQMVQPCETYASQRNPSGHSMHWITRLIEGRILGDAWSVWGNGGTRHGLWFFNSEVETSINATQHSRDMQMPHIPYQGYVMQSAWFAPDFPTGLPKQLEAAIKACNSVSSFAASSKVFKNSQDRVEYYRAELHTLQSASESLSRAQSDLIINAHVGDDFTISLVREKLVELQDRCVNLSEYLASKSLGLDKSWWYGSNHDELFESGEYFKSYFSNLPFLAQAFDEFTFLSHQLLSNSNLQYFYDSPDTAAVENNAAQSAEEMFVDLHRVKKLIEVALHAFDNGNASVYGPASFDTDLAQSLAVHRTIVELLNSWKSCFVAQGRWSGLSKAWQPQGQSDYCFKDVEAIRNDCFPPDPDMSVQAKIPVHFRSEYVDPAHVNMGCHIIRSPEVSSRDSGISQFYQYLGRIHHYNDPLTAARSILLREDITRPFQPSDLDKAFNGFMTQTLDPQLFGPFLRLLNQAYEEDTMETDLHAPRKLSEFLHQQLRKELGDLQRDGLLANDAMIFEVGKLFLEQMLDSHNDSRLGSKEKENFEYDEDRLKNRHRVTPPTPEWWPLSVEDAEQDDLIGRQNNSTSPPPWRPIPSRIPTDQEGFGPTDVANPVVSRSTTTTTRTLSDGLIERTIVVKTRYADGKEESDETVNVERADQSNPASGHGESGKEDHGNVKDDSKGKWFWR